MAAVVEFNDINGNTHFVTNTGVAEIYVKGHSSKVVLITGEIITIKPDDAEAIAICLANDGFAVA